MKTLRSSSHVFFRLLLVSAAGCSPLLESSPESPDHTVRSRAHAVYPSMSVEIQQKPLSPDELRHEVFNFQTKGPLEFLEFLSCDSPASGDSPGCMVLGTHRGWIVESDIPELIQRLDSTEPCLPVLKAICSFLTTELSTIGREAAFLIEGFRSDVEKTGYGGYPPSVNSTRYFTPEKKAILDWWEGYQSRVK